MNEYPPQPWRLQPNGWMSVWRVPVELVKGITGLDVAPFQVFGCAVVCSGFVDYRSGGDLEYRECFLAVLTRGWGVSLPLIWVDSDPALRGGVELWAIPKRRATFEFRVTHLSAQAVSVRIAELFIQRIATWSLPFRAKATIVQGRGSEFVRTPVRVRARIRFCQAQWSFSENSPLACLRHRQSWFSCTISECDMQVGA